MMKNFSSRNPQPLDALIHIVSWLLILGFPLLMMGRGNTTSFNWLSYLHHLSAPLAFGIVFYSNYSLLFPRFFLKGKRVEFFFYNACLIIVVALVLHLSSEWLRVLSRPLAPVVPPRPEHFLPPSRWAFLLRDMVMMCFMIGLAMAICMSREWGRNEAARREAEHARNEAELKSLRNQLSPHFLLNTLNNIYALINIDTDKAQHAVMELGKLLRHMLYENHQKYVPLSREVEFIRNYVELMRLRLNKDVCVTMETDISSDGNILIAPLIFISLIENAFKHGVSPTNPCFVSISIREAEGTVCCDIANSNYPKKRMDKSGSGIGLEQVRRRLELLYPSQYEWHYGADEEAKSYTSILTIHTNNHRKEEEHDTKLCLD